MLKSNAQSYAELRQYLDSVPVIETHEHHDKYYEAGDTLDFIMGNYYKADYVSAGGAGVTIPKNLPPEERFQLFLKFYKKSDKTAFARGMMDSLRICWGIDRLDSYEDFKALEEKLGTRDESVYTKLMDQMNIKAQIANVPLVDMYVDGTASGYSPYCRFALFIPFFHNLHSKGDLARFQRYLNRPIKTLDDYAEAFDIFVKKSVDFGVVCVKDASAYRRTLAYGNPTHAEAEKVFNDMVFKPRDMFGDDHIRVLDDWLFQHAMRTVAKYDLPVQLHTGHVGGSGNDIRNANAANLIPTMELHRDVRFDLFHASWPYMDEFLFIGKNYPNAYLDLCWAHTIDPLYCIELLKRAVMTVPHNKIFAFGGDAPNIEWTVGYLHQARDIVACSLSELVECGWLDMGEARQIAADWFFNNPNEFFKLGFQPV